LEDGGCQSDWCSGRAQCFGKGSFGISIYVRQTGVTQGLYNSVLRRLLHLHPVRHVSSAVVNHRHEI
jgi:P2-related tail formation protein